MDPDLRQRIEELERKVDETLRLTRRTYQIILWTGIITVAVIVLPLIGLVFVIPQFLSEYSQIGNITNSLP